MIHDLSENWHQYKVVLEEYINDHWVLRSYILIKQTLNYYEGNLLKGFYSTKDCECNQLDPFILDVPIKKYPILLKCINHKPILLHAANIYICLQFVNYLNRSSASSLWNNSLENSIAEKEVQLQLVQFQYKKETISCQRIKKQIDPLKELQSKVKDIHRQYNLEIQHERTELQRKKDERSKIKKTI